MFIRAATISADMVLTEVNLFTSILIVFISSQNGFSGVSRMLATLQRFQFFPRDLESRVRLSRGPCRADSRYRSGKARDFPAWFSPETSRPFPRRAAAQCFHSRAGAIQPFHKTHRSPDRHPKVECCELR